MEEKNGSFLEGNYYWRDLLFTKAILGGRVAGAASFWVSNEPYKMGPYRYKRSYSPSSRK